MGIQQFYQFVQDCGYVPKNLHPTELRGKRVAFDAYETMHKLLNTSKDKDEFYQRFREYVKEIEDFGIKSAFVLDGQKSHLKTLTQTERRERVSSRRQKFEEESNGKSLGEIEEMGCPFDNSYEDEVKADKLIHLHTQTLSLLQEDVKKCVDILEELNIPHPVSPGEGEGLCAYLTANGLVDYTVSSDSDFFIYGGTKLIKYLKKGRLNLVSYLLSTNNPLLENDDAELHADDIHLELFVLEDMLKCLNISHAQLVEIAIMCLNDYNKDCRIEGVGLKTGYGLIRKHQTSNEIAHYLLVEKPAAETLKQNKSVAPRRKKQPKPSSASTTTNTDNQQQQQKPTTTKKKREYPPLDKLQARFDEIRLIFNTFVDPNNKERIASCIERLFK